MGSWELNLEEPEERESERWRSQREKRKKWRRRLKEMKLSTRIEFTCRTGKARVREK